MNEHRSDKRAIKLKKKITVKSSRLFKNACFFFKGIITIADLLSDAGILLKGGCYLPYFMNHTFSFVIQHPLFNLHTS